MSGTHSKSIESVYTLGAQLRFKPFASSSPNPVSLSCLQAKYSVKDSLNGPLVKLLNELQKFELAVQNEHSTIGDDPNDIINHKVWFWLSNTLPCSNLVLCRWEWDLDSCHISFFSLPWVLTVLPISTACYLLAIALTGSVWTDQMLIASCLTIVEKFASQIQLENPYMIDHMQQHHPPQNRREDICKILCIIFSDFLPKFMML